MHKHKRIAKTVAASLMAATMLTTTVATVVPMTVSAGEITGEQSFDYKALPWHTCETNPAKQEFSIDKTEGNSAPGSFHVKILKNVGGDKDRWDLQTRHRNLNFVAGHTYTITWSAKASRSGVKVYTKIGDISGDHEFWCCNQDGPHNSSGMKQDDSKWGTPVELSTEWKTFTSTWTCNLDLEAAEWCFHYAHGGTITNTGENTQVGDEIWFDDMSIIDTSGNKFDWDPSNDFGAMSRGNSGLANNFISVNQVGYYTNLDKIAVLGDNKGDILHNAPKADVSTSAYDFEIKDASTNAVVHTGKTTPFGQDADSADYTHKIDFTDFTTPGRYYIQVGEWVSYPFNIGDNIYSNDADDVLTNALNYFYQNRSGCDIKPEYITSGDTTTLAHEGGHETDTATVQTQWVHTYTSADEATGTYASSKITASGGWYDAGDHGKYVVNGGISVWTLQNMFERSVAQGTDNKFADGSGTVVVPETGNSVPDILDEAAIELDWMMEMVVKSDEKTWGKYAGLVYHKLHDHKWTGLATRPWSYETEWGTVRIVKPPTYAATLNFVACAAQAARLWKPYDSAKAAKYLEAAKTSFDAFEKHFAEYTAAEAKNPQSLYAPLDQAIGGGAYGDNNVKDDAYWAACELYASTGDSKYYDYLSKYDQAFEVVTFLEGGENKGSCGSFNWGNTASCGSISLLLNRDNANLSSLKDSDVEKIVSTMKDAADYYIEVEEKQAYGIPYEGTSYSDPVNLPADLVIKGYEWGSNSFVINNAMIMAYVYDETEDVKYMNGVATAMNYLFGTNPLSVSYITGYGSYAVSRPHHRYWSNELDKSLPMAPRGVMSGGPNAGLQDPYVRALGFVPGAENPSQRCFVDSIEAWSTNEVTINWNSPFAWIMSFMDDEAADATDTGVKVTPSNVTVAVGETEKIEVTVNGAAASGATFSSSDETVAKVSSDGTVTGVKEGTAKITVTVNGETKTINVTVTDDATTSTENTKPTTSEDVEDTTAPSFTGSTSDLMYGDVDLNEQLQIADVIALAKYSLSSSVYPLGKGDDESFAKAWEQSNVAHDDKVNSSDLSKLVEFHLQTVDKTQLGKA